MWEISPPRPNYLYPSPQVEARMKTSLHGFMKAGLLDYDTKAREQWVGCHPGQVKFETQ